MRRFMKMGIILHISYPQLGGDDKPTLECPKRTCRGDCFEAVEVTRMKDPRVRKRAMGMIHMTHMVSAYGGQSRTLSVRLNINNLDETRRAVAVDTLKEGTDKAYEIDCVGSSFLSGRYEEERKEQASEQLLKSTRELYRHAERKGQIPVCCEVLNYSIDKEALIGLVVLAACYAGEIRREHRNFGLLVDSSHIPMIHGAIKESIFPVKDCIIHVHMGNAVVKSPDYETYEDDHPRFGFPNSGNGVEELTRYLRTLREIGLLSEKDRPAIGSEVKPWENEPPEMVITNAEHTLDLA